MLEEPVTERLLCELCNDGLKVTVNKIGCLPGKSSYARYF